MRFLSREEYQDRINPWLNKNLHIAHGIPVALPQFRSVIANEVFLSVMAMLLFVAMNTLISLMFSLPGMGSNGIRESFASTFGSTKKFLFISLTLIIYLRLAMFMIGRLTNDLSIAIFAFSMMMIMFLLVGYTPLFDAWVDGRAMNRYLSAPSILVVMWVLPSYFIARKLISQFHEAKRKFLASTASDY